MSIARLGPISRAIKKFAADLRSAKSTLLNCKFCHRAVEKPCITRDAQNSCGRSLNVTRGGGAGAKTISQPAPHRIDFHTLMDQVLRQREVLIQQGQDPLAGFSRKKISALLNLEAERRFIEWQKAARKHRPWHEVLKIPHKGSKHEIKVVRQFRDWTKACEYAQKRTHKSRGAASFEVQPHQEVVPVRPKQLLGFDPNQKEKAVMAKAKKAKGKKAGNGAKAPAVKKDKAYYLRNVESAKTSGDFIRGRILQGKKSAEDIAKEARKKFKGTTQKSDVYWNRGQLKKAGIKMPEMAQAE